VAAGRRSWLDELEHVSEHMREQLGVSTLSVSRFLPYRRALHTRVNVGALGRGEHRRPTAELYPLVDFPAAAGLVVHRRPYLSTPDSPGDPASLAIQAALGKTSQAAAPLVVDDAVWGELWVASAATDLPLSRSELPLIHWAAERFAATLTELNADLPDTEPEPTAGEHRHRYHVWIEGRLDPDLAFAMTAVAARPTGRFTVFAADLDPAELYDLLDRLARFAVTIVGLGRDHAAVPLPSRGSSRLCDYTVRLAGAVLPAHFDGLGVTVYHHGDSTVLSGRLDHSALHGLLRRAQLVNAELLGIECHT
jgi:hypothetical protein